MNGGPSEAAVTAAYRSITRPGTVGPSGAAVARAVDAAHDPALGLDRSVCLRDVVEWLRREEEGVARLEGVTAACESVFGGAS